MSLTVDVYPTRDEIISNESDLQCPRCGKSFSNTSARRLHVVKTHGVLSCEGDKRIYERTSDGLARTYIYHCPAEGCRKRDLRFEGMRNLKQHYIRVHTEKSIKCRCGSLFALQKDLLYHQKKRCLLRDLRKNQAKPDKVDTAPSVSEPAFKKEKKYVKRVDCILGEIRSKKVPKMSAGTSSQQIIQPVILVVPTDNIAATVEALKSVFRTTSETSVQVLPSVYECGTPAAEKNTVAVGMDQPSCYDFGGQFNSPSPYFFPPTACPNTANASSSTEGHLLNYTQNPICYEAQQTSDVGFQYQYDSGVLPQTRVRNRTTSTSRQYLDEVYSGGPGDGVALEAPLARTFGTMVDEKVFASVRNAETSMDAAEFDLLRNIETQTTLNDVGLMTDFWTDMGHSP
uniref:C2H2-type domain-containing protein n=1 Tax=Haemonchus contortus TaxID=6289 RepID=A0A7I4YP64_HAECO